MGRPDIHESKRDTVILVYQRKNRGNGVWRTRSTFAFGEPATNIKCDDIAALTMLDDCR